ncbi:hypothetical protein [Microbacterium enclense]|uniref:hypothetical protein n=1 Tax=Microbacterium enclense TaxID=993073 RepID=UPI003F7F70E5
MSTDDGKDRLSDEYHDQAVRVEGTVPGALAALANWRGTDADAKVLAIGRGPAAVTGSSVQES